MNALIDFALHHSRMVLTALVLIIVAGVVAYRDLPKDRTRHHPALIYVQMMLEGISPEDPSGCCCGRWSRTARHRGH
jgi:multidrug efflux pump